MPLNDLHFGPLSSRNDLLSLSGNSNCFHPLKSNFNESIGASILFSTPFVHGLGGSKQWQLGASPLNFKTKVVRFPFDNRAGRVNKARKTIAARRCLVSMLNYTLMGNN